jgi:hypothetical protein
LLEVGRPAAGILIGRRHVLGVDGPGREGVRE